LLLADAVRAEKQILLAQVDSISRQKGGLSGVGPDSSGRPWGVPMPGHWAAPAQPRNN
jgi:hypothetical protein